MSQDLDKFTSHHQGKNNAHTYTMYLKYACIPSTPAGNNLPS